MGLAQPKTSYTPDEYLAYERAAKTRHEYIGGEIYEMAGEREEHSLICTNISTALNNQLRARGCAVFSPNMKVRTDVNGDYLYPDVTVVCGQRIYHDEKRDLLVNPQLIVEVLSATTEKKDRGEKWESYQQIPSLAVYLLIAQYKPRVEIYVRQTNQHWDWRYETSLTGHIELALFGCRLELADIYNGIEFSPLNRPTLVED